MAMVTSETRWPQPSLSLLGAVLAVKDPRAWDELVHAASSAAPYAATSEGYPPADSAGNMLDRAARWIDLLQGELNGAVTRAVLTATIIIWIAVMVGLDTEPMHKAGQHVREAVTWSSGLAGAGVWTVAFLVRLLAASVVALAVAAATAIIFPLLDRLTGPR